MNMQKVMFLIDMHNERCCEESVCSSSVQLCASLSKFFGGEDRVADSIVLRETNTGKHMEQRME